MRKPIDPANLIVCFVFCAFLSISVQASFPTNLVVAAEKAETGCCVWKKGSSTLQWECSNKESRVNCAATAKELLIDFAFHLDTACKEIEGCPGFKPDESAVEEPMRCSGSTEVSFSTPR
jgi:hypothetical protein